MLMCKNEDIENKADLAYLYINETYRVFRDRLIDEKDRERFSTISHEIMETYLNLDWELATF